MAFRVIRRPNPRISPNLFSGRPIHQRILSSLGNSIRASFSRHFNNFRERMAESSTEKKKIKEILSEYSFMLNGIKKSYDTGPYIKASSRLIKGLLDARKNSNSSNPAEQRNSINEFNDLMRVLKTFCKKKSFNLKFVTRIADFFKKYCRPRSKNFKNLSFIFTDLFLSIYFRNKKQAKDFFSVFSVYFYATTKGIEERDNIFRNFLSEFIYNLKKSYSIINPDEAIETVKAIGSSLQLPANKWKSYTINKLLKKQLDKL